jgi:alpha-L-fucosidase
MKNGNENILRGRSLWIVFRASILWVSCAILILPLCASAQSAPLVSDKDAATRIAWWRDAKFGIFMHWGVYPIPGKGEWVQWNEQIPVEKYAMLAEQFRPDKFDPDAWAAIAKSAGAKYTVLTARHHDGFALFDDPGGNFTSMKSAAHRDFVADYVQAIRKAGLHVGLYYSPLDWRYSGFFFPGIYQGSAEEMRAQYHRQLNELASNYGKIDILWFDGGGVDWLGFGGVEFSGGWHGRPKGQRYSGPFTWQDEETVTNLKRLQPSIIINDRTDAPADFRSREGDGAIGDFDNQTPWELCTTITNGAWGYQPNAEVKPLAQLVQLLVGAVGRDGNFLLNVGPRPDGQIDSTQAERLRQIGQWLSANGESIYGTRGGPWLPGAYGVSTHNGKLVYLHLLHAPQDSKLVLPSLSVRVVKAAILHNSDIPFQQTAQTLTLSLPPGSPDAIDTIVKLELAEPWTSSAVIPVPKQ